MTAEQTIEDHQPTASGLIEGMSMEDYRKTDAVSASDLKNMERSPAYAQMKHRSLSVSTKAQQWGTDVHTAVLEPEKLDERYALDPESPKGGYPAGWRNTKDYKSQVAELYLTPGIEGLLTADQFEKLRRIQKRVWESDFGSKLNALEGIREASVFAWDEEFELWRKCRPDWYTPAAFMTTDLKKVKDHRPGPFARACGEYAYHVSAAYYVDTMEMAGCPTEHNPFLAVNGEAPFETRAYTLDFDSIAEGRRVYRSHLAEWRDCRDCGVWPAGIGEIQEIRIPQYSFKPLDGED